MLAVGNFQVEESGIINRPKLAELCGDISHGLSVTLSYVTCNKVMFDENPKWWIF